MQNYRLNPEKIHPEKSKKNPSQLEDPPANILGSPLTQKSNPGNTNIKKVQAVERILTNDPRASPEFTGQSRYPTIPPVHPRLIAVSQPFPSVPPSNRFVTFLLIT